MLSITRGHCRISKGTLAVVLSLFLVLSNFLAPVFAAVSIKGNIRYPFPEAVAEYIVQLHAEPLTRQVPGLASQGTSPGLLGVPGIAAILDHIRSDQEDFIFAAGRMVEDIEFGPRTSIAFNGVLVRTTAEGAARIAAMSGVKGVFPNGRVYAAVTQRSSFIGVPGLRDLGFTGEGVTVAVIDTGIDYTHPDLGGGFGPGFKVIGGYDFVNEDPDPMDDQGHGTHVAGIVAADGPEVKGVAPGAKLLAYKALGAEGWGTFFDVIRALDQAVLDGADIVNMSLGSVWYARPEDPPSQAADNVVEAGLTVVVAAGNYGPYYYTVGTPGAAARAITVAASYALNDNIDLEVISPEPIGLESSHKLTGSPQVDPWLEGEIVFAGLGGPWDYWGVDPAGKIVLADRGEYTFLEKAQVAASQGAVGLIVGNNQPGPFTGYLGEDPGIPVVGISQEEAALLKDLLAAGPVAVRFTPSEISDRAAIFSSRGPASWLLKPDVIAPGVEIGSTVLSGQYEEQSGTSMAAPMVAGLAALLKQRHPDWTPDELKSAICNTGEVLKYADGTMVDPLTQGGGRVDVDRVLSTRALVSPTSLSYLAPARAGSYTGHRQLTLTNFSDNEVTYSIDVAGNSLFYLVSVDMTEIVIPAGESRTLAVTAVVPDVQAMLDNWLLGAGYILLDDTGSPGSTGGLQIPFLITPIFTHVGVGPEPVVGTGRVHAYATHYLHGLDLIDAFEVSVHDPHGQPLPVRYVGAASYRCPVTGWAAHLEASDVNAFTSGLHLATVDMSIKGETVRHIRSFAAEMDRQVEVGADWHPVGPAGGAIQFALSPAGDRILVACGGTTAISHDAAATWVEVSHWTGLGSWGHVTATAINPRDPSIAYLGTESFYPVGRGSVLRSHDGGLTWYRTNLPHLQVADIALNPADPDHLFAVCHSGDYGNLYNLYETLDGGQTWAKLEHEFGLTGCGDVLVFENALYLVAHILWDPDDPYQWPENHVLRRDLDGRDFTVVAGEQDIGTAITGLGLGPGGMYLAGSDGEVYYTRDGGVTWTRSQKPGPECPMSNDIVTGIVPVSAEEVYVASMGGIFRSLDGGQTFAGITPDVSQLPWLPVENRRGGGGGGIGPFGMGDQFLTPPGSKVEGTPGYIPGAFASGVIMDKVNGYLYVSLDCHGLFRSDDHGATWEVLRPTGSVVYDIALSPEAMGGKFLFAGVNEDIARAYLADGAPRELTPGSGLVWRTPGLPPSVGNEVRQMKQDPHAPGVLYKTRTALDGGIMELLRSVDYGESWDSILYEEGYPTLALHPTIPGLVCLAAGIGVGDYARGCLWVSQDAGDSWSQFMIGEVYPYAVQLYDDPSHILLGTSHGLYRTADGGETWENPNPGFDLPVYSVARHAETGELFLATRAGLFVTADGGVTITRVPGFPEAKVNGVKAHPDDSNLWFATFNEYAGWSGPVNALGVYMSSDGGVTWQPYAEGLTNRLIYTLELDGDWAYLATASGVWVRNIGDLVTAPALARHGDARGAPASGPDAGPAGGGETASTGPAPFIIELPAGPLKACEPVLFTVTACDEEGAVREDYAGPVEITIIPRYLPDVRTVDDDGEGWMNGQKTFEFTPLLEEVGYPDQLPNIILVRDPATGDTATAEYHVAHFVDHYVAVLEGSPAAGDVFRLTVEARTAGGEVDSRENSEVEFFSTFVQFFDDEAGEIPAAWPKRFDEGRLTLYASTTMLWDWALWVTVWHEAHHLWRPLGEFQVEGVRPGPAVRLKVECPLQYELEWLRPEVRAGEELEFRAVAQDAFGNDFNPVGSAIFEVVPGTGNGIITPDGWLMGTRTGTLRVRAILDDLTATSDLVIVRPGVPVTLQVLNPTAVAEVGVPYQFFARGVDARGNLVPGVDLRWNLLPLGGSGTIDVTYGRLVPSRAGEIVVQVLSLSGASTSFSVQVSQGALDHLEMLPAGTLRVVPGQVVHLKVNAYDVGGNLLGQPDNVAWGMDPVSTGSAILTQGGMFQGTGVGRVVVRASYNGLEVTKVIHIDPMGEAPSPPPPPPPGEPALPEAGDAEGHAPDQVVTVVSADKVVSLTVRPGTLDTRYSVSIGLITEPGMLAAYDLAFTAHGRRLTALAQPVELTIDLTALGVTAADRDKIVAVGWDPGFRRWLPLPAQRAGSTLWLRLDRPGRVGLTLEAVGREYADIAGHWAQESIRTVSALGIIDGYPDGSFGPDRPVTRVELAKLIVTVMGAAGIGGAPRYGDADQIPDWARDHVGWASSLGLMSGYPDGTFRGEQPATRAEVAAILARMLAMKRIGGSPGGDLPFNDAAIIPAWSREAVYLVLREGIVQGYEDGTFRPGNLVTRAEMVVMLLRFLRRVAL